MKKIEHSPAGADPLRQALLRTSSSVLALQRRAEEELQAAKRALEAQQRELESSLALLRTTLDASPDGIAVIDLDGRVLMVNRRFAAIWGLDDALLRRGNLAEMRLHSYPQFVDPAALARCGEALAHQPQTDTFDVFEMKDGRTFERYASPRHANGCCEGVVVMWRDVTDNRRALAAQQAQQLAERANRAKSDFVARMSHELRTPLHAILGFAEMLQLDDALSLTGVQRQRVGRIHTAGSHLLMLIDDLLDMSRLEAGTVSLQPEPVDAVEEVRACLATLDAQAVAHGVDVRIEPVAEGAGAPVLADRRRLQQVLLNLVSNAIKYNRPHGTVSLRFAASDGQLEIVVADSGLGLHAEQLAHLFEPFNRLGRETLAIEGTGIGLVIAKSLVELMGGTLTARSWPGNGSEFTVRLRCAGDAPGQPAAVVAGATAATGVTGVTGVTEARSGSGSRMADAALRGSVVYIDDDEVNRVLMQAFLTLRPGVDLRLAADGRAGLEAVAADPPDLLLIDMMLPDTNGLEVLRALRANPATRRPPCVAVSANAMPGQIAEALDAGFDGYLTKPLAAQTLLAQIDRWLGRPD